MLRLLSFRLAAAIATLSLGSVGSAQPLPRPTEEAALPPGAVLRLDPKKTYPVYFLEPRKQRGATVLLSGKQAGAAVPVRLEPCGRATARFVDRTGKPLAGYRPTIEIVVTPGAVRYDAVTDAKGLATADGAFLANVDRDNWNGPKTDGADRVSALIPGITYRIMVAEKGENRLGRELTAIAGKTIALGDIAHGL